MDRLADTNTHKRLKDCAESADNTTNRRSKANKKGKKEREREGEDELENQHKKKDISNPVISITVYCIPLVRVNLWIFAE